MAGRVAALVRGDEPTAADPVGRIEQAPCHLSERRRGEQHAPERVERAGVEAARDHDQLWIERLERRDDDLVERGEIGTRSRACRQRDVERRSRSGPLSDLLVEP